MVVDRNLRTRTKSAQGASPQPHTEVDSVTNAPWASVLPTLNAVSKDPASPVAKELLRAGFEALDLLGIGLLVCSDTARLLVANRVGEQILRCRDGLELNADGEVSTTPGCGPSLTDAVRRIANPRATDRGDLALAVRRPSKKRALTLLVRSTNGTDFASGQPAALILILDSALPANTVDAELRQLYGLTPAETKLAKLLMEGITLDDCCRELGIRRTTGRMHLRNLFAKTGVARQGELVALLLKSIGLGPRQK